MQGGHADSRRNALATQGAPLGQVEPQRPGTHRPNAWATAGQRLALAPDGTGTEGGVQGIVEGRQTLIEPGNMRLKIRLDPRRCAAQAVGRRRAYGHELPSPGQEGPQVVGLRVRQRSGGGRTASAKWTKARASSPSVVAN